MSTFTMRLPDVGEGVAEAEIVEWLVAVGDEVTPESPIAEVLTDKATVEISAPVSGTIAALHGEPGEILAVGADFVEIETDATTDAAPLHHPGTDDGTDTEIGAPEPPPTAASAEPDAPSPPRSEGKKPTAAPAVRARAAELGIVLADVAGTGPDGRVVHADLDRLAVRSSGPVRSRPASPATGDGTPRPVRGVRRRIADRLTSAWTEIPHITYVDAVDVTELDRLRRELNERDDSRRLTLLPFLVMAIVVAVRDQPDINAHYDHAGETLTTFDAVHVGIATQTDDGLRVPVVRHAESLGLGALTDEIGRVTEAARDGRASREELTGSTITITSLGALGGLVTTPILNPPEVAIVGVNKIETRPMWQDGTWVPRRMMNLSSSFDHRMVDGWDAAVFVQRLKALLETPALLFVDDT